MPPASIFQVRGRSCAGSSDKLVPLGNNSDWYFCQRTQGVFEGISVPRPTRYRRFNFSILASLVGRSRAIQAVFPKVVGVWRVRHRRDGVFGFDQIREFRMRGNCVSPEPNSSRSANNLSTARMAGTSIASTRNSRLQARDSSRIHREIVGA